MVSAITPSVIQVDENLQQSASGSWARSADGISVLLIRGLTREQRHWGAFKPLLQAAVPHPVLSYDFAGTGQLYQQESPGNISALRQSVRTQWLATKPSGKVHLVAISLGGMLAADWALHYPQEVASLVLINSSAKGVSAFYQRLSWRNYPAIAAALFYPRSERERLILQLTSHTALKQPGLLADWQRWQQQYPVSTANALRQLWAASRFGATTKPGCATLLIRSLGDKLVSPACSQALAAHWQAPLLSHPWGGHDLPLDDAPWLVQQLAAFYASLSDDGSARCGLPRI